MTSVFSHLRDNSPLLLRAAKTAMVVGTILLIINQYEALIGVTPINTVKAVLSYCVPFCVFLYGSKTRVNP
ncbi:hypothetical protein KUL152_05950 [Tenacibaculum sp. KUL152]|nr:hypothetical protein KUL152_05950 [Tenacibaculum sp. KUL152]